jgi:hypothetical protein
VWRLSGPRESTAWLFVGRFAIQDGHTQLAGVLRIGPWFRFRQGVAYVGIAISLYGLGSTLFHFHGWQATWSMALFPVFFSIWSLLLRWSTRVGSLDQSLLVYALYNALEVAPPVKHTPAA